MAIIDRLLQFARGQTVTGGTTVQSTDIIDLNPQSTLRALGTGRQLWLVIHITGKSGGDGSDTFVFALQHATTETSGTLQTPADVVVSPTITGVANITVGQKIVLPVPPGFPLRRYVGVRYAVTADAVLTVDAYLTDQHPTDNAVYPDAI